MYRKSNSQCHVLSSCIICCLISLSRFIALSSIRIFIT
uniref:Uncharacterized protein n=1 Tax=Arundo donax TaxID=35708 RepID=A0A0A8ZCZ0_ARUDO